jgi:hypothetical protein
LPAFAWNSSMIFWFQLLGPLDSLTGSLLTA